MQPSLSLSLLRRAIAVLAALGPLSLPVAAHAAPALDDAALQHLRARFSLSQEPAAHVVDDLSLVKADLNGGVLLPRAATNLQAFQGSLAGVSAAAITQSGDATRPFEVDGKTFNDYQSAANRACDNQHNSCADAANNNKSTTSVTVSDCDNQNTQCKAAASSSTQTAFNVLTSSNADFDIFCDV